MSSPEDIALDAKWDQVDAARERLRSMQLKPFEYMKPDGRKRIRVDGFSRMEKLLDDLAYMFVFKGSRDFTDEELERGTGRSIATIKRAICECVGRGLLKVNWLPNVDPSCGPSGVDKRRYEIQWDEVDRANPELHAPPGLDSLP